MHELRNTDNPSFIRYTPTTPLARHRLRNQLFSHTSTLCARARATKWVTQGRIPFLTKYSGYIFIVRNFMNQILDKLNNHARIIRKPNNPLPNKRQYTVSGLQMIVCLKRMCYVRSPTGRKFCFEMAVVDYSVCLIAYNSGPSYFKNARIGLTSS
jgi:hypothetical protein